MKPYLCILLSLILCSLSQELTMDTRHSFHPPFFLTQGELSNYRFKGTTIVDDDFVRLTPSEPDSKGLMVAKNPLPFDAWEAIVELSIGADGRYGADGMAFWYAAKQVDIGPVFGGSDFWTGLGVFFDTYDNDGKRDNPMLYAILNDGTESYDHENDGGVHIVGSCRFYYRSNPYHKPRHVKIKVRYEDEKLSLWTDGSGKEYSWTKCFVDRPAILPSGYYFGFSAETGTYTDIHDLYSFQVFNLKEDDAEYIEENENPNGFFKPNVVADEDEPEPEPAKPFRSSRVDRSPGSKQRAEKQEDPVEERKPKSSFSKNGEINLGGILDKQTAFATQLTSVESQIEQVRRKSLDLEVKSRDFLSEDKFRSAVAEITVRIGQIGTDLQKLDRSNNDLQREIRRITTEVVDIKSSVESSSRQLSDSIRSNNDDLETIVGKHTSTGFWTFFIVFQLLFILFFVVWKQTQKDISTRFSYF